MIDSVYALFTEDEQFPVAGGDFSSDEIIEGAGSFSLDDPASLDRVSGFPADEIDKIDSAATMIHMMNQNTFTAGAYHVVESADMTAVAEAIRVNIQSRQWMCGFPDKLVVAVVGDCIVSVFGNEELVNAFASHLTEAYSFAEIVVDEPIL